jgi:iron complex outermembrane receptor protein
MKSMFLGYYFTFDDDFSSPGTISTVEGAFLPQAGINFLQE